LLACQKGNWYGTKKKSKMCWHHLIPIMKNDNFPNVLENTPLLIQFIEKVWFEPQTPSIIQLVSSNADFMVLCAAIANNAASSAILHSFTAVCRQKSIDIRLLRRKLIPVAAALGLTIESVASQDCYYVLGLTPSANTDEIKKAFRQKARTVHPDTDHSGKSQSHAFIELLEAYQTLSNPESRRRYDQKYQPEGLWNEKCSRNQRLPRKFGYIYMIVGLALFFITAAFIFDFIFREEVLSDIPFTGEHPPVFIPKRDAPLSENAKDNPLNNSETTPPDLADNSSAKGLKISEPLAPSSLPVQKALQTQHPSDSNKQMTTDKNDPKKSIEGLYHPFVNQNSDVANQPVSPKLNLANEKRKNKTSLALGTMEYIDTEKTRAVFPFKNDSPLPSIEKKSDNKPSEPHIRDSFMADGISKTDDVAIVPTLSPPVFFQSDENDHRMLFRNAKDSASSTLSMPRSEKDIAMTDYKDKIATFLKTYCMAYEQKKLKKFASFFKPDAIENGKPFHSLLPQYRHNFANIDSITYTIVMHRYSYLSDSTDIRMEGEFFIRWHEYGANWKKNNGSIFMHLEQTEKSFLVKQLYYLGGGHKDTQIPSADKVSQIGQPAINKKIEQFLNNYCQTYQSKNLTQFASFFRPDATENGKPFHSLLPQYRHTFSMIDSMTYNIVIHRHFRLDAETVRIDGAFAVRWHQYNKNWRKNSGSISMVLSVENDSFRVKALNYSSD